jgi:tetratricopeptide (TPR) repeat protein
MLFAYYACDQCDRIVPRDAGFRPDSSLPNPGSDFVLCSTQCVNEWNAAHGSQRLKITVTERNKNHTIKVRRVKSAHSGGRFEFEYVDEKNPYDTGTFGLDRPLSAEEIARGEAVIDEVIAGLDDPEEKEPLPTHVQPQPQAPAKIPEGPAVPQEPIVSPPSPAEIAGALKAYKALLEEQIIPEAEYNYIRGKIMGAPVDAADVVSATAKTAEDIRAFKTMADEGLITQEDFDQKRQQILGYKTVEQDKAHNTAEVQAGTVADSAGVNTPATVAKAKEYFRNNEYDRALTELSRVISAKPDDPMAYITRATVYMKINEHKKALSDLKNVDRLSPGNPQVQNSIKNLGIYLKRQG